MVELVETNDLRQAQTSFPRNIEKIQFFMSQSISTPNLPTLTANLLWFLSALPESVAFHHALNQVAGTQETYLRRLLRRNAKTAFGRAHNFTTITSVAEYQDQMPLSTYEDYEPYIRHIGIGQNNVLTHDPVQLLEPTSGSTAATKYIPYTNALKTEFQRAIAPWIVDLFRHHPRLPAGQAYWSVSPITHHTPRTASGIPIGFEEDSEYFGRWQQYFVRAIQAVPGQVKLIQNINTFRYITLLFLLRSRRLTLISVWNPTFLTLLVQQLTGWWPQLADDIERGSLSPPTPLPADLHATFQKLNRPNPRRAAGIRRILQSCATPAERHARLWPHLRLISCWTEAQAAPYAAKLAQHFPQARIQGKGLLATEGIVSIPLTGQPGAALALRSHFFEFLPVEANAGDRPLLAHQLETGRQYEVILSTGGGLYRYRLHDLVEVAGHLKQCPLLKFTGKAANIADHFGEKLNETHARQALEALWQQHHLRPKFAMLACETTLQPPAYILFIEAPTAADGNLLTLGQDLEPALQENFHYRYCRDLGQLGPLRIFRIHRDGLATYVTTCQSHGQRAGDIKPVTLHRATGWLARFSGKFILC